MKRIATALCAFVSFSTLAACGGSNTAVTSTSMTNTSAAASTSAVAPVDTVEQQRNAQATGWGTDGSGLAVSKLTPNFFSTSAVRVFRRVHIDTTGGMRVVSTQDAFVTALTMVIDGGVRTTRMQIHGFVTRDGEVKNYTMAGFGTGGIVNIALPDRGDASMPVGWTVVSRDTIAMLFANFDGGDVTGSIEFWSMATGKIDARFGKSGRIDVVGKKFGVNAIYDLGLRMVEDDGRPHLLVVGADALADGYARDVRIIGLNADGSNDTAIAKDAVVSVKPVLGDDTFALGYLMSLADPGVDNSGRAIGLAAMTQMIDFDPEDGIVPSSQIGMAYAKLPADAEGNLAVSATTIADGTPSLLNAVLDPAGPRVAALSINPGTGFTRFIGSRDRNMMAIAAMQQIDAISPDAVGNSMSTAMSMVNGTWLAATTAANGASGANLVVCFDERQCKEGSTAVTRPLLTRTLDGSWLPVVTSAVADSDGLHVAVSRSGPSSDAALVSFDVNGATASPEPARFVAGAGKFMAMPVPGTAMVSAPTAIDKTTLVAMKSTAAFAGLAGLVSIAPDGTTRDIAVSPALGQIGYTWEQGRVAFFDAKTMVVRSALSDQDGRISYRLQKVSFDNGSTLGSATTADFPANVANGQCPGVTTLVSSSGVAAIVDTMTKYVENAANLGPMCTNVPERVRWMSVLPDGTTRSGDASNLGFSDDEYPTGAAPDATGALYIVSRVNTITPQQQVFYTKLRVRKLLPTGGLDTRFGNNGVVDLDESTDNIVEGFIYPAITVDAAGRVYLATTKPLDIGVVTAAVRLNANGAVDRAPGKSPQPSTHSTLVLSREQILARRAQLIAELELQARADAASHAPADPVVTIAGDKPVLLSVRATQDRALDVSWGLSAAVGETYVTATALPGGRSCTAKETTCVIRGLDATETYVVVVSAKGDPVPDAAAATLAPIKPVRIMKPGRVASPTTLVRPASRGKATWKVGGKCTLNANFTKFTAAPTLGKCRLAVTTAKDGKTPKTTKSVTIVVTK